MVTHQYCFIFNILLGVLDLFICFKYMIKNGLNFSFYAIVIKNDAIITSISSHFKTIFLVGRLGES